MARTKNKKKKSAKKKQQQPPEQEQQQEQRQQEQQSSSRAHDQQEHEKGKDNDSSPPPFEKGMAVEVRWGAGDEWLPATIHKVRSKKGTLDVQFGDGRKEKKVPMGLVRHESTDAPLLPPGKEQFVDDSILDKYMEPQDRKCNLDPQGTFMRYWDAYVAPALWLRSVPDQAASRCVALRRFAPNPVRSDLFVH